MASKIILVTGGNRSIGHGIVTQLARQAPQNTIIIASRKKENAEKAIAELKASGMEAELYPLMLDVDIDESIKAAVNEVDGQFGRLDGTCNRQSIAR